MKNLSIYVYNIICDGNKNRLEFEGRLDYKRTIARLKSRGYKFVRIEYIGHYFYN